MTDYQRETRFLRDLILFDDTAERHKLEARIAHAERDLRCVKRAAWFMGMFTGVCAACLAYGTVLLDNFPYAQPLFVIKVICEAGLASLICLVGFGVLLMLHRWKLNHLRDECRRLATKLLEARLGKPVPLRPTTVIASAPATQPDLFESLIKERM